jgi:hypothetical protein
MKIRLERGIDPEFGKLLYDLYRPFLSAWVKTARGAGFTVYAGSRPVGVAGLKKQAHFVEIGLTPEVQGRNLGLAVVRALLAEYPSVGRFGWTAHKGNLPSILLLQQLGGGFLPNTVKRSSRIEAEGFFRRDGSVLGSMREALTDLLPDAQTRWTIWKKEHPETRANARTRHPTRRALDEYLSLV